MLNFADSRCSEAVEKSQKFTARLGGCARRSGDCPIRTHRICGGENQKYPGNSGQNKGVYQRQGLRVIHASVGLERGVPRPRRRQMTNCSDAMTGLIECKSFLWSHAPDTLCRRIRAQEDREVQGNAERPLCFQP